MFSKLIKKPYYFVPPCPCCNSPVTGYYAKSNSVDPDFTAREGLKNGELVLPAKEIPYDNAFCLDCGFTWHHVLKVKFLSLDEISEQKRIRNSAEFYNSVDFKHRSLLSKIL